MSTTRERNLLLNAQDNSTPVFLGMARTIRAVSREIHFFTMILNMLEKQEEMTGFAATFMGTALRFAIPGLGLVAGLIGIIAAVQLTQTGGIQAVGQTMPGEFREIKSRSPIIPDVGEVLGRPQDINQFGGGGGLTMVVENLHLSPGGMSPDDFFRYMGRVGRTKLRTYTTRLPR